MYPTKGKDMCTNMSAYFLRTPHSKTVSDTAHSVLKNVTRINIFVYVCLENILMFCTALQVTKNKIYLIFMRVNCGSLAQCAWVSGWALNA